MQMSRIAPILLLVALAAATQACGKSGPLYLPDDSTTPTPGSKAD